MLQWVWGWVQMQPGPRSGWEQVGVVVWGPVGPVAAIVGGPYFFGSAVAFVLD